jgi:hypothetical protein
MNLLNRLLIVPLIALLILIPVATTTGCSSTATTTQAKINAAVLDIQNWAPIVAADATTLLNESEAFAPADAVQIQALVTQIQKYVAPVQTLCATYLANPSAGTLAQIAATVNGANTAASSALLAILNIKDAHSQAIAKTALVTITTALTILTTYLATTGQTASITVPRGFTFNNEVMAQAMNEAKGQQLLTSNVTSDQVINELTKRGVVKFV